MVKSRFVTLEGGEGVGKSTLLHGLVHWLKSKNIEAVSTREPGGTLIADEIRRLFKSPPPSEEFYPETELLLVSAARAQHVTQVIQPTLAQGKWIISDRFADSSRVYQGILGGVPLNELEWITKFATKGLEPDLTFLLDCDVQVTSKRIGGRGDSQNDDDTARYDQASLQVHERLRQGFRKVAGFFPARFFILDASLPPEKVLFDACAELERRWQL